jgi:hypothetical protein
MAAVSPDLARQWMAANLLSLLVTAALGFVSYGLRASLGLESVDTETSTRLVYVTLESVFTIVSSATYAYLAGSVLRRILPALPWRSWMAMHILLGTVVGPLLGLVMSQPSDGEPVDYSDGAMAAGVLTLVAIGAAFLGAAYGGLQSLILRGAAEGMRFWIWFSALSNSILLTATIAVQISSSQRGALTSEIIGEFGLILSGVAAAFVMLSALGHLKPRNV